MAEEPQAQKFEQALEGDLSRLAEQVRARREQPGMESASEVELIKEAVRAFPETISVETGKTAVTAAPSAPPSSAKSPLPAYAQAAPAEVKLEIEYLLDIALRQGLGRAVEESRKSSYFVQDAFHDALAGRLYPELQRRGVVK